MNLLKKRKFKIAFNNEKEPFESSNQDFIKSKKNKKKLLKKNGKKPKINNDGIFSINQPIDENNAIKPLENKPNKEKKDNKILIKGNKIDKKLEKLFQRKKPIEVLPTHENDQIGEIKDFKITYQIRQAVKSRNIITINSLISLVNYNRKSLIISIKNN